MTQGRSLRGTRLKRERLTPDSGIVGLEERVTRERDTVSLCV